MNPLFAAPSLASCVRPVVLLIAALALAGCPGPAPKPGLTCGSGTLEQNGECVARISDAGTPPPPCGVGTIERDGGCVGAPPAPPAQITRSRLTLLKLKYDLAKPLFLNNSLPLQLGITSHSADNTRPVTSRVMVMFSFVEAAPADPANPKSCDSGGLELQLVGNGLEQQFEAELFPTSDCAGWVGAGAQAILKVDFDPGLRAPGTPTGIDYPPVVFSMANQAAADNQLCRKSASATAPVPGKGCFYSLSLKPTPSGADGGALVDIELDSLHPESSVAVVWPAAEDPQVPDGGREADPPSLVVQAVLVMDGRDPYKNQVNVSKLPPELIAAVPTIAADLKYGMTDAQLDALDDLPGNAVMRYDLAPSNKISPTAWLPLAIDDPANPDPDGHVSEIVIKNLEPGTDNGFTHALFIEGATRDAVKSTGPWANDDDFTVRGCLVSQFEEGGNADDADPDDAPVGGDVANGDCKTFKVRLVKAPPPTGSASAQSFDHTWERVAGDVERVALVGKLRTSNTLDLSGARTDTEGTVEIKGKIGSAFTVQLFRAYAKGGALTAQASSFIDCGVDAFGVNLLGYQNTSNDQTYTMPYMVAKSFQFPGLSFGFGPVSVGITAGVGGNVGLTPSITLSAKDGPEASIPELAAATSNGMITTTTTPNVGLTGNVTGGIDVWVAKAAAVAEVQIIDIGFPLTATVRWGVTATDPTTMAVTKLAVLGDLKWDMTINWLNVKVDVVGSIRLVFFNVSKTFNVFTYTNPVETVPLLNRKLEPIVLE